MEKFNGKRTFKETQEGIIWDKKLYKKGTKEFKKLIKELAIDMVDQVDELITIGSDKNYIYPKNRNRKDMEYIIGNFQSKYHYELTCVKIMRLLALETLKINNRLLNIYDIYNTIMAKNEPTLEEFYMMVIFPLICNDGKTLVYFEGENYQNMVLGYIDGSLEKYIKKLEKDKEFPQDFLKIVKKQWV